MLKRNKLMQEFLKSNGIKANVKYIDKGSLRGNWRISNHKIKWWGNSELINKFKELGFLDFDYKELSDTSGNGGLFSIFVRHDRLTAKYL